MSSLFPECSHAHFGSRKIQFARAEALRIIMLLASVPLREVQFSPLKFPWRARCARRSTAGLVALFQPALAGELRTLCVRGEFDINLEIAHCTRHLIYRITLERRSVKSRLSTYNTI